MNWNPKGIIIHATESADDIRRFDAGRVRGILTERGLRGYHWLFENIEGIYWCSTLNRPDGPAEHVHLHNSEYLGFAFIGDFRRAVPPPAMLKAGAEAVAALLNYSGLMLSVLPHREAPDANTDCPGDGFMAVWDNFIAQIAAARSGQ